MGVDEEPGRREPVKPKDGDAEVPSRRARCVQAPRADDAHTDLALRLTAVRADLEAVPRASGPVGGRVRPSVYKLTHATWAAFAYSARCPAEELLWQTRSRRDAPLIDDADVASLKGKILAQDFRSRSWSRRGVAPRRRSATPTSAGGARGALGLARPKRTGGQSRRAVWPRCSGPSSRIQNEFNGAQTGGKLLSLADLIVSRRLRRCRQAAKNAGTGRAGSLHAGPHGRMPEQNRRRRFAVLRTAGGRLPELSEGRSVGRFRRGAARTIAHSSCR